jgi:Pentapeptide repeats (8 copies)
MQFVKSEIERNTMGSEFPDQDNVPNGFDSWQDYWTGRDMPWRIEPEIAQDRKQFLEARQLVEPDINRGLFPFRNEDGSIPLTRADVEWLIEYQNRHVHVSSNPYRHVNYLQAKGLDFRGANLNGVNLTGLPLAGLHGELASSEVAKIRPEFQDQACDNAAIHLEGAHLVQTNLEAAILTKAHLDSCSCFGVHLEGADLTNASLRQAKLMSAHLEGAQLVDANLERIPHFALWIDRDEECR